MQNLTLETWLDFFAALKDSFLERVSARVWSIVQEHSADMVEAISAIYAALWGLWILNPFVDTFAADMHVYRYMRTFPEWIWGLVAFTFGAAQLIALLLSDQNGPTLRIIRWRNRTTAATAVFFVIVHAYLLLGDWHQPGLFAGVQWTLAGIAYLRLKHPVRSAD